MGGIWFMLHRKCKQGIKLEEFALDATLSLIWCLAVGQLTCTGRTLLGTFLGYEHHTMDGHQVQP